MKYKKILIVSILLLAILTIGAVSASGDAEVLAGNSTVIIDNPIVIDNNNVEEVEGNFTFSASSDISLDNGYNTVATLNLKEATAGRIVLTNYGDEVLGEKSLTVNDFNKVSENYIYNLQVRHLDVSNFYNGNQLVNFMFYSSQDDGTPAIHEVYDVEKSPQTNSIWIKYAPYIEIYEGFITEDYDGPIIVVYSDKNTHTLSISDFDEVDYDSKYSYYSALNDLNQYDCGIYSKNRPQSGWYYYGVTASDFINNGHDFNEINDGDTLSFLVRGDNWAGVTSYECNIDLEGDGFYLGDHNDEPVGPTTILEIYGNEYMPISYENGMVFTIIVSGDEKTGSWKPVDELSNARICVYSGEIDFINEKLSDLDYDATGYMNNIEHVFTLNDVNDFSGLESGDTVNFMIVRPGVQDAYEERIIQFNKDNIMLSDANGGNDFEAIFQDGNVQEDTNVLIIPKDQIPEGVDETFTITVDIWGNVRSREYHTSDYEWDDVWEWSTFGLEIDDIMSDIFPSAECDIAVQFYRDGEEAEQAHGQVRIYNSPFVDSQMPLDADWPVITIAYFPEDMEEFTVIVYENSVLLNNFTFKVSEMDQYLSQDECYELYLSDIGIDELGGYGVEVEFPRFTWYNHVFVVPFVINFYHNWDEMTEPLCRIALPEGSEGNVTIELNGNKVYEKALEDIYYDEYFRGPGYYVDVNSLNITESGSYVVHVTVTTEEYSRNVSAWNDVEVSDNAFAFRDSIYGDFNFDAHIGTAISQDSAIILYLNGEQAATGGTDHGFYFNFDESYTDIYGNLLPGEYQARLEINGETVCEDSFAVLDTSGNVDVEIFNVSNTFYINFKAPMPSDESLDGYALAVFVDCEYPGYDDEPIVYYYGDNLMDLLDKNVHTIELGELEDGEHIIYFVYRTDMDYPLEEQDFFVRIYNITVGDKELIDTTLTASNVVADYNGGGNIVATLKDANGNAIRGADVKIVVSTITKTLITDNKGQVSLSLNGIAPGSYTAAITFDGNDDYKKSNATANVNIKKAGTIISAPDVSVAYKDADGKLVATITNAYGKALGVNLNVDFNGESYTVRADSNGQITIPTNTLSPGNYTATVSYAGNVNYKPSSATAQITVNKADTIITAPNVSVNYNDPDGKLVATLTNAYGKALAVYVNVTLNGETYAVKANSKGQVIIPTADLTPKKYTVTISYKGNVNYNPSSATARITVTKADTVMTAPNVSVNFSNPDGKLVATLTNAYGNPLAVYVNVTLNGETYAVRANSKGEVIIPTADLTPKKYTVTISYKGNGNYNPSSATARITVTKADTVMTAPDVSVAYKDPANTIIATLTNAYGKALAVYVNVTVNGVNYVVRANNKGQVSVSTANLAPGTYAATISYKGNGNYNPSIATTQITVNKADTVITAPDVSVAYKDTNGKLVATITNAYGKPLAVNVNVNFNGESYTVRADSNGQITIPTSTLSPGTYTATISYAGNVNYNPSSATAQITVNKADTIITAPNVSVNYANPDGKLVATLTNVYGKALSVYVNVTLNGETYAVRANSKGEVIIPTADLTPKKYTVTIAYKGNVNYNPSSATARITVTKADTVMAAPNVSVNFSNPDGKLVATLTNVYGKALSVYVNVTLNGETYAVRANSKGEVIIPTADLTPKKYTVTIAYKGNGNYNPSSATARITVTKADTIMAASDVSVAYKDPANKTIATLTNAYGKALAVYVNVTVNGEKFAVRANSKGQVSVSTANLAPGTYAATISYKGNGNYNPSTATTQITVEKADTIITAPDVAVNCGDSNGKLVATLTNAYGKALSVYVTVNLNGVSYDVRADSNGQIIIPTKDLASGNYTATITYKGNGNYNPTSTTANISVK